MHRRIRPFLRLTDFANFASAAAPAFTGQRVSLDLNGTDERLRTAQTATALGIGDTMTLALWWKPDVQGTLDYIVDMDSSVTGNQVRLLANVSTSTLQVNLADSAGTTQKVYRYTGAIANGAWNHLVLTFDGTDPSDELLLYRDGILTAPSSTPTDNACTRTDTATRVGVGCTAAGGNRTKGLYHSLALWDSVLTSGEQLAVYNSGAGKSFDLANDSGGYSSSGNLVRWWRLGFDSADIGKEYVDDDVDLMDNAVNIDSGDIVPLAPADHGVSGVTRADDNYHHYVEGPTLSGIFDGQQAPVRAFSVSFWVKQGSTPNQWRGLAHNTTNWSTLGDGFGFYWQSGTQMNFYVGAYGTPADNATMTGLSPVGEWLFVVGTYDADQTPDTHRVNLYVNAVSGTDFGTATDDVTASGNEVELLRLGASACPDDDYNDATIDEFAVWNVALTSGDISRLYNAGVPTDLSLDDEADELLLWWRCGDSESDAGTTLHDESGNDNDGTLMGDTGTATIVEQGPP